MRIYFLPHLCLIIKACIHVGLSERYLRFALKARIVAQRHIRASAQHFFVHLRRNPVIRIHKGYIFPGGGTESGIACGRSSAVGLVDHLHPRVLLRIPVTESGAGVCGAIVHKDQFKICERLVKNAVHALLQIFLGIVDWNNDTDFWHSFLPSLSFADKKHFYKLRNC